MRILIVEDEVKLAEVIKAGLEKKGYAVDVINNGEEGFKRLSLNHMDYDLVILDLMLPDRDGFSITKALRERNITTPIIILTARNETDIKVELLLSGADDYIVKPFSFDELLARITSIFRRPHTAIPTILSTHDVELNTTTLKASKRGKELPLTLKEFMLLEHFLRNPDKVISREELLSHLWDFNYSSFSNVVDVHVKNLRKKLDWGTAEGTLETVRGIGYRLKT